MEKENDKAHGMTAILQVVIVSFSAGNQCRGTSGGCLRLTSWLEGGVTSLQYMELMMLFPQQIW